MLLELQSVSREFAMNDGRKLHAVNEVDLDRARRGAGPGGRVRLRQVHAGPAVRASAGPDARQGHVRRPRHHPAAARRAARAAPLDPVHLPGSAFGAEPAHDHPAQRVRAADPAYRSARRQTRARGRADGDGRPAGAIPQSLSARAVGRPEAARVHRPRHRAQAQAAGAGRPTSALDVSVQAQILGFLKICRSASSCPICSSRTTWR